MNGNGKSEEAKIIISNFLFIERSSTSLTFVTFQTEPGLPLNILLHLQREERHFDEIKVNSDIVVDDCKCR